MKKLTLNKSYIEDYMEQNGITSYEYLANQIGIANSTFTRIMNGKRSPGGSVIRKILMYFKGVEFETLFFWDDCCQMEADVEKGD